MSVIACDKVIWALMLDNIGYLSSSTRRNHTVTQPYPNLPNCSIPDSTIQQYWLDMSSSSCRKRLLQRLHAGLYSFCPSGCNHASKLSALKKLHVMDPYVIIQTINMRAGCKRNIYPRFNSQDFLLFSSLVEFLVGNPTGLKF